MYRFGTTSMQMSISYSFGLFQALWVRNITRFSCIHLVCLMDTQGNRLNGVLFIQVYLLDQQFGISKQMFERCQMF